jgi:hypothetical protein
MRRGLEASELMGIMILEATHVLTVDDEHEVQIQHKSAKEVPLRRYVQVAFV